MNVELKLTFTPHGDKRRVEMLVEGNTPRGSKYRKILELRPELPIDLKAMQEFLADCSYEARNFLPIPDHIAEAREVSKAQRDREKYSDPGNAWGPKVPDNE